MEIDIEELITLCGVFKVARVTNGLDKDERTLLDKIKHELDSQGVEPEDFESC